MSQEPVVAFGLLLAGGNGVDGAIVQRECRLVDRAQLRPPFLEAFRFRQGEVEVVAGVVDAGERDEGDGLTRSRVHVLQGERQPVRGESAYAGRPIGGAVGEHDGQALQGAQRAAGDMLHPGVVGKEPDQVVPVALAARTVGPKRYDTQGESSLPWRSRPSERFRRARTSTPGPLVRPAATP
ncbi:hypothetical protein OHA64_40540 [Streptomyces sp. NBC_00076]